MEAIYITLILNLLLLVFLLFGFFWGIGRGLKKSAVRLVFFIFGTICAALLSNLLSMALLNIQIPIQGTTASVNEHIFAWISSQPAFSELYQASPAIQALITKLPALFLNVFSFLILLYFFKFISWIFYASLVNVIVKKKPALGNFGDNVYTIKEGQPVILTETAPKKYRLGGGFIGLLQGLILCFFTLLPISGFVAIFNNVTQTTPIQAQELNFENLENSKNLNNNQNLQNIILVTENQNTNNSILLEGDDGSFNISELPSLRGLINDYIPSQVFDYTSAYSNSILSKISIGLESVFFDSLASITVNDEVIILSNEIETFISAYENFITLYSSINGQDFTSLNFTQTKNTVNTLFNSGIIRAVGNEVANFYLQKGVEQISFGEFSTQVTSLAKIVEQSWTNRESNANILKTDILTSLKIFEITVQSELLNLIIDNSEINENIIDEILLLLAEDDAVLFSDILNNLTQSETLKKLTVGSLNLLLESFEDELFTLNYTQEERDENSVSVAKFDRVSSALLNWISLKNDFKNIFLNAVDIYFIITNYSEFSPEIIMENSVDSKIILNNITQILDIIQNSTLIKDTVDGENILNQTFNELNKGQYAEYVNFSNLNNVTWTTELETLIDLYDFYLTYANVENIDFVTFDYENLKTLSEKTFESDIIKSLKFYIFTLVLEQLNINESENSENETLIDKLYNDFDNRFDYVSEMKNEFGLIIDVAKVLGTEGIIQWIIYDTEPNWTTLANSLNSNIEGSTTETKSDALINDLIDLRAFRITFVELLNNFFADMEYEPNTMGQIQKTADWNGWSNFNSQLKEITTYMLEIIQNSQNTENLDSIINFSNILNGSNAENSVLNLGRILDILATAEILKYEIENVTYSIYDNLITNNLADYLYITPALTENYTANFWFNEFSSIYEAFDMAKSIIVDDINQTSLLDGIIAGNDFKQLLTDARSNGTITDSQIEYLLGIVINSELLKNYNVVIINSFNKILVNLIDNTYDNNIVTLETDISGQEQDIIDIIMSALVLEGKTFDDLTNEIKDENIDTETSFINIMATLQSSHINNGIFGGVDGTYIKITNFLTDDTSTNEFTMAVVFVINNSGNVGTTPETYDWPEILNNINDYL